jgi:uncharacterized protein (TIGR00297 family)
MLSTDGAVAAATVGTACAAAGWDWAVILIVFFVSASGWSRVGRVRKETLTAGIVTKGGERDAVQVIANGGVFALCAVGYVAWIMGARTAIANAGATWSGVWWRAAAGGALASASGDTWATEIGTLWGGRPRSILTGRPVAPGTSGGVTPIGTCAGLLGAGFLGAVLWGLGWPGRAAIASVGGGVAGLLVDSVLGATLQRRRWCERCNVLTERDVHVCDAPTRAAGGLSWLDNDGVNALSTLAGACMALILYRSLS